MRALAAGMRQECHMPSWQNLMEGEGKAKYHDMNIDIMF